MKGSIVLNSLLYRWEIRIILNWNHILWNERVSPLIDKMALCTFFNDSLNFFFNIDNFKTLIWISWLKMGFCYSF